MICHHIWILLSPALEECSRCGAQRTPPTTKRCECLRPVPWTSVEISTPPRIDTDCIRCGLPLPDPTPPRRTRYVHLQSGDIIVPDIHGVPTTWTPITLTRLDCHD